MRRRELFEFEDLSWFPASFRDPLTDWLQDLVVDNDLYAPAVPVIVDMVTGTGATGIVDVCSGGGGPWAELKHRIEASTGPIELTLTDKYPNQRGLGRIVDRIDDGRTSFRMAPVDATSLPDDATGLITSFSALHHLPPPVVEALLAGAQRRRQPVALFDMTARAEAAKALRHVPVGAFRSVRSRRPRSRMVTICTYVPVLPLAITWDAVVSNLRAYEPEDLQAVVDELASDAWKWEVGLLRRTDGGSVTYVTGRPLPS